jgi:hypothetical protein
MNMKKNKLLEEINTEEYRLLLKKHFNFKIVDKTTISEEEMELFNQYIDKKITDGHKHYEFETHLNALILQHTNFFYEIEGFLIGVFHTPNNKDYIIGYKLEEYYSCSLGTTVTNWIANFEHSSYDNDVKEFMIECNKLYGTGMELYNPGEDDYSNFGLDFN